MSQVSRIRKNSLFVFLSSLIRLLSNVLVFVGVARLYGPEEFGQFTTAHTMSAIFILFADFGFDVLLTTEVARRRDQAEETARKLLTLKVIFAGVATMAMAAVPWFGESSRGTSVLILIFSGLVFFTALGNFFFAFFKGFEELYHETRISFAVNSLLVIALVVFGIIHVPLPVIAALFVGTRVLGVLLAVAVAVRRFHLPLHRLTLTGWKVSLGAVAIYGFHFLFGSLYFMQDTILLSWWKGDTEVGLYQSVFKIAMLLLIIPDIAINTLLPTLSRLNVDNARRWQEAGSLVNRTLVLIGIPVAAVVFVFADQILALVYGGSAYAAAAPVMRVFSVVVLVRFAVETPALMLTTSARQWVRLIIVVAATFLNLGLNWYAIPRYGIFGAAMVSLVTAAFVGAGYTFSARSLFRHWARDPKIVLPAMVMGLLALISWEFRDVPLWFAVPPILLACGAVSYLLGYSEVERKLLFAIRRGD